MASLKHTHTYERSPWSKTIYRCADPECTHYNHKLKIMGKVSLCNSCHREFILTAYNLKTSKPKCELCSDTKVARAARAIAHDPELLNLFTIDAEVEREREAQQEFGNTEGTAENESTKTSGESDNGVSEIDDDIGWPT